MQLCKDSVTLSARALNKASEPVIGSGSASGFNYAAENAHS